VPRRRREQHGLQRVLGAPALFATVYGNVGSSIYYALGVTAAFALGLTPLVFLIAGVIFAATTLTYAEGTVRFPEAGGSSSFARHAFNEVVSFGAAWAQMLNYVITISISAFFVPHYLSIFWGPLKTNPWDIIVGAGVIAILVLINIVGIREAAKLNIGLAVNTEKGLLVPVLREADRLDLAEIAAQSARLIEGARAGTLTPADMTGGTITLTNVGASGPVETGTPIINPPECCVVGFGAIKLRPMVLDGQVVARQGAWISISVDHRIVDGAMATEFLTALVDRLERFDG